MISDLYDSVTYFLIFLKTYPPLNGLKIVYKHAWGAVILEKRSKAKGKKKAELRIRDTPVRGHKGPVFPRVGHRFDCEKKKKTW